MLIRVFGNSCKNTVSSGSLSFNGTGKFSSVTDKVLDYLKQLNVTHVWYTGVIEHATCEDFTEFGIELDNPLVVKGLAGSPYAIKDYYDVNPYLADNPHNRIAEFRELIERTHNAGLKVIIDFVPNHLARKYHQDSQEARKLFAQRGEEFPQDFSDQNFYLLDSGFSCKGFISAVPDVQKQIYLKHSSGKEFEFSESPAKATGNNCFSAEPGPYDWYETVKLNYDKGNSVPDTWLKMRDVLLFWLGLGVDGFRCDMAEMVPVEFWNYATGQVKERFPNAVFIGELYNTQLYTSYLNYGGFDYLYDKEGLYDNLKSITQTYSSPLFCKDGDFEPEGRLSGVKASAITLCWQQINDIQNRMLNFLENHDEQRIASKFNAGNGFAAVPELVVGLMLNKAPFMLYFGEEFGERGMECEGYSGCNGRTSIFDWCSAPSVVRFLNGGSSGLAAGLEESERELLAVYKLLLNFAMGSAAVVGGDTYDLSYCQHNVACFSPDKHFVFARVSRLDINNPSAPKEVVVVSVDFSMKGVGEVFIPGHFMDFASLESGREYDCCWLLQQGDSMSAGSTSCGSMSSSMLDNSASKITLYKDSAIQMREWNYGVSILKLFL